MLWRTPEQRDTAGKRRGNCEILPVAQLSPDTANTTQLDSRFPHSAQLSQNRGRLITGVPWFASRPSNTTVYFPNHERLRRLNTVLCVSWTNLDPSDPEPCLSSFPSSDTLKHDVLSIGLRSLDFFTWETHHSNLPLPSLPFHKALDSSTC